MSKSKLDIRRAMTEHNISYAVLSERTGIDKGNISKLFTGNITLKKMEAVADAIGIDITELFYPEEAGNADADLNLNPNLNPNADGADGVQEGNGAQNAEAQPVQTVAFCPHCGAKVRVGVVLMQE